MPQIDVLYFMADSGSVPVLEWLENQPTDVQMKCLERIQRLERQGHDLRRPIAENLGKGIWELRVKCRGDNYRILYFFDGRTAAVLAAGFMKNRGKVPESEMERALERKMIYQADPRGHAYEEDVP